MNPLRYRGYYYDKDTGLYYLQSRYYDSKIGRFINSDNTDMLIEKQYTDILQCNLFAYTFSNFMNYTDAFGSAPVRYISNKVKYNRSEVKKYIKSWAKKRNKKFVDAGNNDCTNFVSQCLYAGGLQKMDGVGRKSGWHSYKKLKHFLYFKYTSWDISESWSLVKGLQTWLINTMHYRQHLISSKSGLKKIIKNGSLKPGAVVLMSTKYDGKLNHAVIVGRVTKDNAYYYAHTSNRNANSDDYGLMDYFNDAPKKKNGFIAVFYIY